MSGQWRLILALAASLVVAVFAVINVDPVQVDYLFGTAEWPLILIIIGSALLGGLMIGSVGMWRIYRLQQEIKQLRHKAEHHEQSSTDTPSPSTGLKRQEAGQETEQKDEPKA
ncbi:hypothetical protein GCM10010965_00130 [Caldalkalibacillus thermarum]|uniref:LapA family protein n=1 Tax=Caldalkalibacillus thermarum TaxID=296745 RepID=UPI001665F86F|nr:lipopolysaccharide assembly protein LapA domain-containing protein [Caldalkalibacillus thermarum]GGK11263.1 hypothetical protein GCM10010965_00130 [Caldalkalibacillus thermarum]